MPLPIAPTFRSACDPEFPAPPTAKLYFLRNRKRPITNFIDAEITIAGFFRYAVQNEPKDGLGCPGAWLFEMAFSHFEQCGVIAAGIRGSWTFGTNLATINQLTKSGAMGIVDAAKKTWAFDRASSKGFTQVTVLDSDGVTGNFSSIDVVFLP